jgi:hypothetical protein
MMKRNSNLYNISQIPTKTIHKGVLKTAKICPTCNIVRPFRSSHCNECDNCVLRYDHHCFSVGNCIGKRNYVFFYFYLIFLNLNNYFILFLSSYFIYEEFKTVENERRIIIHFLINCLPSIFTIIYLIIFSLIPTGLLINHTRYLIKNITTKEDIKKLINAKIGNPYNRGCCINCIDFFCRRKKSAPMYVLKQLRKKAMLPIKYAKVLKPQIKRKRSFGIKKSKSFSMNKKSEKYYRVDERNNIDEKNNEKKEYSNIKRTYTCLTANKKGLIQSNPISPFDDNDIIQETNAEDNTTSSVIVLNSDNSSKDLIFNEV